MHCQDGAKVTKSPLALTRMSSSVAYTGEVVQGDCSCRSCQYKYKRFAIMECRQRQGSAGALPGRPAGRARGARCRCWPPVCWRAGPGRDGDDGGVRLLLPRGPGTGRSGTGDLPVQRAAGAGVIRACLARELGPVEATSCYCEWRPGHRRRLPCLSRPGSSNASSGGQLRSHFKSDAEFASLIFAITPSINSSIFLRSTTRASGERAMQRNPFLHAP